MTTHENPPSYGLGAKQEPESGLRAPKRRKTGKPAAIVKFGSAAVPVYQCDSKGRERYILSYHRNGKRMRQSFCSLPAAKKEALLVAQRIQQGHQHVTDMTPADRDAYVAATKLLAQSGTGIPLVAAIEDYLNARAIAGTDSLAGMAADYARYFRKMTSKATVPEVVKHLLEAKRQDGLGVLHLRQLVLKRKMERGGKSRRSLIEQAHGSTNRHSEHSPRRWHLRVGSLLVGLAVGILSVIGLWRKLRRR